MRYLNIVCCLLLFSGSVWAQKVDNILLDYKALDDQTQLQISTQPPINGKFEVKINGDITALDFRQGKAAYSISKVEELVYIKIKTDPPASRFYRFDKEENNTLTSTEIPLWLSILPPLIAILLALIFKEVIISLFVGIWLGAYIANGLSFKGLVTGFFTVIQKYVVNAIADSDHVSIIVFSMLIGGMVAIISRNGGMAGVVEKLSKYANNARNSQLVTWFLGIAIFFDDYANTLIVGNTMRPVTDKFRISREKLAYLVDSTAAPIAAIAFVSTWIGAELGYISDATAQLGMTEGAYSMFFHSLQFAFYPVLTLAFILMLVMSGKDFGPMFRAEKRARMTGEVKRKTLKEAENELEETVTDLSPVKGKPLLWYNAFIPVLAVIVVTIIGLLITGMDGYTWNNSESNLSNLSAIIGNSNSYIALLWASLSGALLAIVLSIGGKILSLRGSISTLMDGIKTMLPAIIILIMAWSLAGVTKDLYTADFLATMFEGNLNPMLLPAMTFLLAALVSFSTGSSWGAMAMLYPLMLPATWVLCQSEGLPQDESLFIFYNVISVVLAGSVLGDHCSPISDTTILSSLASDCNHIDHVSTQLPYALIVGVVSILIGGGLVFLGLPWFLNFAIGIAVLWGVVKVFGRKV